MSTTATANERTLTSCSFCEKPSTQVQRLVAGPGVHICNECVALATWVVEDAASVGAEERSRRQAQYQDPTTDELLATLRPLVRSVDRVERELANAVIRLRSRGTDWLTIAAAADMSVEDAHRRFGATTVG